MTKPLKRKLHSSVRLIVTLLFVAILAGVGIYGSRKLHLLAAGNASLSLSPASGSYQVGNNLAVNVSVTSDVSDGANGVQLYLTYSSANLTYVSTTLTGPFTTCPPKVGANSGGGGAVYITCAAGASESGTQPIATINFTVTAAGTGTVAVQKSGTDIKDSATTSIWDGVAPSASYSLTTPPSPPPPPPPSTQTTTPPATKSPSTTKSTTTKSPTSPATTTTQTPTTTTPTQQVVTTPTAQTTGSITLRLVNSKKQSVIGATVTLNNSSLTTDSNGLVSFKGVEGGTYTLSYTVKNKHTGQVSVTLQPGENKLVSATVPGLTSNTTLYILIGVGILALLILAYVIKKYLLKPKAFKSSTSPISPPKAVVGGQPKPPVQVTPSVNHDSNVIKPDKTDSLL